MVQQPMQKTLHLYPRLLPVLQCWHGILVSFHFPDFEEIWTESTAGGLHIWTQASNWVLKVSIFTYVPVVSIIETTETLKLCISMYL